eukprot:6467749-Amphidinium_carterae.1
MGLSTLQQSDQARVQEANMLAQFTANMAEVTHKANGSVVLENPRNAYYWLLPSVANLLQSGFEDFDYHSCAWGGARSKKQRLRSNCPELKLVRADCKHVHDDAEWQATRDELTGQYCYPTAEEQEYTAELAFVVATALSMHAAATGRYKLHVPRPPQAHETGDRALWILWPAHLTRSSAMVGVGLRLGLPPPSCEGKLHALLRIPSLQAMPEDALYIGQGSLPLRLPKSKWASQFVPGPHGSPQSCLVQYAIWVDSQGPEFIQRLSMEVEQRPLLCDCAPGQPCHGEVLVQMLAAVPAQSPLIDVPAPPRPRVKQRRRALSQVSGTAALLASAAAIPPARSVEVRWSQTALHR